MTASQIAVFRLVSEGKVTAFCDKTVWHFREVDSGDTINARTVRCLEAAGLIKLSYYSGGVAGVNLTDSGRTKIAQMNGHRLQSYGI